ncbi:MAG: dephospho-CoA kinase [Gammaproteobacteria bacterium]|nr:dephospho-CoA kinase [Gammaproteobacteria bacterium]
MLVIGLTGGIGSGKSTVADLFSKLGVPIIDTDILARKIVEPGQIALQKLKNFFGNSIIDQQGCLNRKKLAELIFNDESKRKKLESILHPEITRLMQHQLGQLDSAYAIVVIPLLVETEQNKLVDRVLLVDCSQQQQIQRVLNRDERSQEQIEAIIKSQASAEERLSVADDVINNRENTGSLSDQVEELHKKYLKLSQNFG